MSPSDVADCPLDELQEELLWRQTLWHSSVLGGVDDVPMAALSDVPEAIDQSAMEVTPLFAASTLALPLEDDDNRDALLSSSTADASLLDALEALPLEDSSWCHPRPLVQQDGDNRAAVPDAHSAVDSNATLFESMEFLAVTLRVEPSGGVAWCPAPEDSTPASLVPDNESMWNPLEMPPSVVEVVDDGDASTESRDDLADVCGLRLLTIPEMRSTADEMGTAPMSFLDLV
ncbi:hypothetical protein PINS_up005126 [Pythium insidiosum]|nr:hypothetical protein PINS_up005126 [Pythium insidiosum]